MRFTIITHVSHIKNNDRYLGYAPYVREMNLWLKNVDYLTIVAPLKKEDIKPIDLAYESNKILFREVPDFSFTTIKCSVLSIFKLPIIFCKIFSAMYQADHIHLRCPGNMGLVGCFVQMLFPYKTKTAKYAGNWDPKSQQPWTYKLQKFILSNTFLTKNMQVLVYGEWENQSKNIKPFFTATYRESEKEIIKKTTLKSVVKFVFVGSLVKGKKPLYAIKVIEELLKDGLNVTLDLYGEGVEREKLQSYIELNNLERNIILLGNQNKEVLKAAYKNSHFVILPSISEGWPKAIAEGMFWGCVPVATEVSCIGTMLNHGKRGILLKMDLNLDLLQLEDVIKNENCFLNKSQLALEWSRNFTIDFFENEIKNILLK